MPSEPTIYDVARRADVSISTVSQTLNRPSRVRPGTRERVLEAIQDLGYAPKGAAVTQARRGVGRVGVFAPFTGYGSYGRRLHGILRQSAGQNRDVVVYDQESAASTVSPILRSLPVTGHLDGLLIMGLPVDDRLVEQLAERRMPAVLIDSFHPDVSTVVVDDERIGAAVGRYLLDAGHRAVAFVHEEQVSSDYRSAAQRRLAGLVDAVAVGGLPTTAVAEFTTENSVEGGRRALREVRARRPDVTAVLAHHDLLASGVLGEARRAGLDVPGDIAVVGVDDGPLAEALDLTTVFQPFEETGHIGASLLAQTLRSSTGPFVQHVTVATSITRRATA